MKRLLIILFLCLIGTSHNSQAQTLGDYFDMLDDLLDGEYDESVGPAEMFYGGFKELMGIIGEEMNESAGLQFSSYTKCLYMMILYALEYEKHVKRINEARDCEEKYDLYGVLLIYIASSTGISYCPESFLDLFDNPDKIKELEKFYQEMTYLYDLNEHYFFTGQIEGLNSKNLFDQLDADVILVVGGFLAHYKWKGLGNYVGGAVKDLINEYFHPEAVIKTTLETGEKMDALPCSPGSRHRKN